MSIAFVFPGQGSQQVGMGRELAEAFPAAREAHEEVDTALGQALSRLMWEGPEDELTLTENAQPAIMTASMAALRVLEREGGFDLAAKIAYVAGHSLGEYAALCAAGSVSLADTARLLKIRGRAMQEAVPVGEGAMAALLGVDLDEAAAIAEGAAGGEVCEPANDNAPGQVVLSGARAAVERAVDMAKDKGKRAMLLQVSAPFHCALMAPAAEAMAEALAGVDLAAPRVPVVTNVTAGAVSSPEALKQGLVEQVTGLVRWRESVAYMVANGVSLMCEVGSGKVLSGLARRIDRNLEALAAGTPGEIEALAERL